MTASERLEPCRKRHNTFLRPSQESMAQVATATGSRTDRLARNAFFLLAGQVASLVLSAILTAVLGRRLGVVEFGVYYLLTVASGFAAVFVDWGQRAYLIRESVRRPENAGQLLGGALAFRAAMTFVAAVATALLMKAIGYDSRTELLALFAVVSSLPITLSQAYTYLFRGRDRPELDATVTVTGKAITVAVTVPALILGGGLSEVLSMQAIGGAGALLVAVLLARKIRLNAERPGRNILHELARGGGPIAIFFLAMAMQPFIDVIVLSKLVPPEVVGWYGAARNIMGLLLVPASILATASLPELSRVSGSTPDLRHALRGTLRLLLALGGLAAAGTFLFADVAVSVIYGRGNFEPAVAVLQFFAPVTLLYSMDMLFAATLTAAGKTKEIAVFKALSVAIGTGLNVLFIPVCQARMGNGGIGLVLALGSTEVLMLTAYLWLVPRGAVDRSALADFLRAAAAAGATVLAFSALPSITPWLGVPACVAGFTALAIWFGLILGTDLEKFAGLARNTLERAAPLGGRGP
jgi:O-antigen/teichoic acid export membrane protein